MNPGSPQDGGAPHRAGTRELVLRKRARAPLSRAQAEFNRRVRRIERLRREIERETGRWNDLLAFYSSELHPLEQRALGLRKEIVRRLRPFLKVRALPGRRRRATLRELIRHHLVHIADVEGGLQDADLEALREEVDQRPEPGMDTDAPDSLLDVLKVLSEAQMKQMGYDVDLSKFRMGMTPEEIEETLWELNQQMEDQERAGSGDGSNARSGRPNRAAERARAQEEARERDLGALYKQLAKLLHPDLEPDLQQRAGKEAAMKELTSAYKEKDLHAMLRLELEWIQREQTDVARLTDEKLRVYNTILKEQVVALETELRSVGQQRRFATLARYGPGIPGLENLDPMRLRRELELEIKGMRQSAGALATPDAAHEVRLLIADFRKWMDTRHDWLF